MQNVNMALFTYLRTYISNVHNLISNRFDWLIGINGALIIFYFNTGQTRHIKPILLAFALCIDIALFCNILMGVITVQLLRDKENDLFLHHLSISTDHRCPLCFVRIDDCNTHPCSKVCPQYDISRCTFRKTVTFKLLIMETFRYVWYAKPAFMTKSLRPRVHDFSMGITIFAALIMTCIPILLLIYSLCAGGVKCLL